MYEDLGPVEVATVHQRRFQAVWPCAAHAMQQVQASLQLVDAGFAFVAGANARIAFEHAVIAQWILLTDGGDDAVLREASRQFRAKTLDALTFVELPEHLLPGPPVSSEGPARAFAQLCDRFSPPVARPGAGSGRQKLLYSIYRSLSGAVHPSTGTWAQYFAIDEALRLEKGRPQRPSGDLFVALALASSLAMGAIEELRLGQPRLESLRRIGDRYGVPITLRHDDQNPELQPPLLDG